MGEFWSIIFSVHSKKMWLAFIMPMIVAAIGNATGVDVAGVSPVAIEAAEKVGPVIGAVVGPILTGFLSGGPLGAVAGIAAFVARNGTKLFGK